MTIADERNRQGREPFEIVEIDLDSCNREYSESYTNLLKWSEDFLNAVWYQPIYNGGGADHWTVTPNQLAAPDGTATAEKFVATVTPENIFARQFLSFTGSHAPSIYVFIPSGQGVTNVDFVCDFENVEITNTKTISTFDAWVRIDTLTATAAAARAWVDFDIYPDGINPVAGFTFYSWGGQLVAGIQAGHYVKTEATSLLGLCSAGLALSEACYNTRNTCQDPDNYTKIKKTYRFCTAGARLPKGDTLIPCLVSNTINSPEINLNQSVGLKGSAKIVLQDFTHHDRGVDPYVTNRIYDPETQGTYFGRLRARNIYYQSRSVRAYKGYFTDPIDLANFDKYEYLIDRLEGVSNKGQLTIIAKDPLKLAGDDRAKCPVPNTGVLLADITDVQTTAVLSPSGVGDEEYPAGVFKVRIGSEILGASRAAASDNLTIARAEFGTTASSHDAGETIQLCTYWEDQNVVDIIEDILTNYTEIPASYIPSLDWADQKARWLTANILTAIISEPEGVETLINELIEVNLINLYWNDRASEIILKSIIPDDIGETPPTLSGDKNFLRNSISVKDEPKARVSRLRIIFSPRDQTEFGGISDFKDAYIAADLDAESGEQYGEERIKTIMSRWLTSVNRGIAIQTASRLLQRYRDNPFKIDFTLDPKDGSYGIGESFTLDTRQNQDVDGSNKVQRMQVISVQPPKKINDNFKYKAASVSFIGNFAFIAPAGMADYSAASEEDKGSYSWIAQADGTMLDGSPGYLIV